jgi:hypothetical protein
MKKAAIPQTLAGLIYPFTTLLTALSNRADTPGLGRRQEINKYITLILIKYLDKPS